MNLKYTDLKGGFLAAVQELSSVHSLGGNEEFLTCLELVRISEMNDG